jgi:hypothetical protein
MLNSYLSDALVRQQTVVEQLKTTDTVGAVLTVTRDDDQAITTGTTTVVWQREIRNYQYTVLAGGGIIVPEAGWYLLTFTWRTLANLNDLLVLFRRNGLNTVNVATLGDTNRSSGAATGVMYCNAGDTLSVAVTPSANTDLIVINEFAAAPSPILHIVQLSGPIGD